MSAPRSSQTALEIEGRTVRLTTPDRVLWPLASVTKAQLIDYYIRVAPVLLPHLVDRPVALGRYPEGVDGKGFIQIRCPPHPAWVRTEHMYSFTAKHVDVVVIDDLPSLVWAANLSSIELHPYLARMAHLDRPDVVVFDLDPGPPAGMLDACRVSLRVRNVLTDLGLASFPKTSGGKGVHVYVPIAPEYSYAETKAFARAVAGLIAADDPDVVDRITETLRPGKVFVDWGQNDHSKSMAVAYSLRAQDLPLVSTPLEWAEVEAAVEMEQWRPLLFGPGEVLDRVEAKGDLFAEALTLQQRLPATSAQ